MNEPIKRNIDINLVLTPQEIAFGFCNLHSDSQAEFFNEVAKITKTWSSHFVFQLQGITDEDCLTKDGRKIMSEIGEYSSKGSE
tara:strand:- start:25 stop:276 length:252 start_codon:yes stop_codon:yes gene_type:complete